MSDVTSLELHYEPGTWSPRSRTTVAGPESDLIENALAAHRRRTRSSPLIFREPELPTGFPDIVAVFPKKGRLDVTRQRLELENRDLRLLHHVQCVRQTTETEIKSGLRFHVRALRSALLKLEAAHLISRVGETITAEPIHSTFPANRIVAIEAKIRDWRGAIWQAARNTWFASHSYVLLPDTRCTEQVGRMAERLRVGVLAYDGTITSTRVRAHRHALPGSYGSWLVGDWALRQLKVGRA